MEASRFKRRGINKNSRQITQKHLGNTGIVTKASSVLPRNGHHSNLSHDEKLASARRKAFYLRQMSKMSIQLAHHYVNVAPKPVAQTQAPAPRRSLLDMSLPGEESRIKKTNLGIKWRRLRRNMARATAMMLVMVITFGGLFLSQSYLKMHKVFNVSTANANSLGKTDPNMLKGEAEGRVNVLIMGKGGGKQTSPDLTDSMMLMSVDVLNNTATVISIPRDLWVNVPGGGPMKINAAWETGVFKYTGQIKSGNTDPKAIEAGFANVDSVVSYVLGVPIHYNMIVNFSAFKQAVDTVGGITINAPETLVDKSMAKDNNGKPLVFKAGRQVMKGSQALMYARSQETSSDLARTERQRAIFLALKSKIQQMGTISNPVKVSGLLTVFGNNVSTDLSFRDASRFYKIMKGVPGNKISAASLMSAKNNYLEATFYNNQHVIMPTDGMFNYAGIRAYMRTQIIDPYIVKENAKILVLNGTQTPKLANRLGDALKTYGYHNIITGNTPAPDWTQSALVDLTGKHSRTKASLESRLGMKSADHLEDTSIPTNGADFVIIIGNDEVITTQTGSR